MCFKLHISSRDKGRVGVKIMKNWFKLRTLSILKSHSPAELFAFTPNGYILIKTLENFITIMKKLSLCTPSFTSQFRDKLDGYS